EQLPFEGIERLIPPENQELVFRFFLAFSRFEYALKRAGYTNGDEKEVQANWVQFASIHRAKLTPWKINPIRDAWDYFSAKPPRKQIVKRGRLDWSRPKFRTTEPELTWLLDCIRTVRNNLFHGGKFPLKVIDDPTRNPALLSHALAVIHHCA